MHCAARHDPDTVFGVLVGNFEHALVQTAGHAGLVGIGKIPNGVDPARRVTLEQPAVVEGVAELGCVHVGHKVAPDLVGQALREKVSV